MSLHRWEVVWTSWTYPEPQHHSVHLTLGGARSFARLCNRFASLTLGVDFYARRRAA